MRPFSCVCVLFVCFLPEMFNIWQKGLGVSVKDNCCFPYHLIAKFTYICTSWSSIKHFSPRQTMQERITVNDKVDMLWQLHIKMFGQWLYAFRKQSFIFHLQDNVYIFWSAWSLFLWFHQFPFHQLRQINYGHLFIVHTLEVLDCMPKRSQTSLIYGSFDALFLWWRTIWVSAWKLGVCMEIRVAHIVTALCPKQSFIHSSFAFTSLDHVTFCLQQYVFKNWLLKRYLCAYQHQSSILSLLGTLLQNLLLMATKQTMIIFLNLTAMTLLLV